ncbi:protocadherin beta-15-like [Molothrus ater]|uniref:protocadherin beta-15-like n=1 Tax=Molothrus ater TaxID=84834 RepID=UPI0023E781D9|nr:protocadherin beta-15-like [Molothrus ater]
MNETPLSFWVEPGLWAALVKAALRCRPRVSRCLRDRGPGRAAARAAGGGGCSPSAHRWVVPSAKAAPSGCGSGGGRARSATARASSAQPSPAQPSPVQLSSVQLRPAQRSRAEVAAAAAASAAPCHPLPAHPGCLTGRRPQSQTAREGARPALRRSPPGIARDTRRDTDTDTDTGRRRRRRRAMALARQVLCVCALLGLPLARAEPIRYSVAEEAESGSLVGELAEDAGLTPAQLSARRARLVSEDGRQHFRLERASGRLVVAGRLDREELCAQSDTCMLPFELLLSNPLQFFRVEVTLQDINDHSPVFPEERVSFDILETSEPRSLFPLEVARDLDIGSNTVQAYNISPRNEYFSVSYGSRANGDKYLELILEKPLDREEQAEMDFLVIAVDGGSPPRSGTVEISIIILDVNDNAPKFTEERYDGKILENMPEGSVVLTVMATDPDAGVNGDISYQLSQAVGQSESTFVIDPITGEIKLTKPLDFEAAKTHEISVRARDGGGLSAICKVLVEVVDVNDNAPELVVSSFSSPLPENTVPGTVVALFTVRDRDSGANGKISCALQDQLFFSLRPAYKNYYELVTVSALDREETPQYVLRVTAADAGSPPLSTTQTFTVDISDVNDNAPVFNQTSYTMYVRENNVPTVFVGAVSAADADVGLNAKVTYSLAAEQGPERPWCSCISVNSETGHVFVLRPLDYEHLRQTEVTVSASDAGSPPLRANVTVRLVVLDENDNAPLVLYPAPESSPASSELVPVSAEAGYLISKVVAVDADSGQNSWLSYHLLRATDPGLFSVGLQSGEVRLRRPVTERDSIKQKLLVLVRDNGKPPLSATAALSALLLKDFSDVRLPHSGPATEDQAASLTTYLIIALVFVSLLFLISTAALVARRLCRRKELKAGQVLYAADTLQSGLAHAAAAAGTLPRPYCYEISLTTGSGNSEFRFLKPILPSLPPQHCAVGQGPHEEQDFPAGPASSEDMAPDSAGTLSAGQFNALSFD